MNFLEAAEIAKKNSGSTLQRGESGQFVVRMRNGDIISSPSKKKSHEQVPASHKEQNDTATRLNQLEALFQELLQQREIDRNEIDQLRLEINDLKDAFSKIPDSEWKRYEKEHKEIEKERQLAEAKRLMDLVRAREVSTDQLNLILDNANYLGLSDDEQSIIRKEITRNISENSISAESLPVRSTTDEQ